MLDTVVKRLIEFQYERALRQSLLASSVRLGEDQLPEVWRGYQGVLATLDMPEVYDLYLTQWPIANAAAIGAGKPMIVVNSHLVALLDDLELRTVLAHEAGHILSDHTVYRTALLILLELGSSIRLPLLAGLPLLAVRASLQKWVRAGEYDRIIRGEYPKRSDDVDPRAHAGDAVEYYSDRFRTIFRETGENLAAAGERFSEWLRGDKA